MQLVNIVDINKDTNCIFIYRDSKGLKYIQSGDNLSILNVLESTTKILKSKILDKAK